MGIDRRRFYRIPQSFDVQYRAFGALEESWCVTRTVNLSAVGIRFRSGDLLEPGTMLEMQITLPTAQTQLALCGSVIWSQMQASGVAETGVDFLNVTPEQQLQIDQVVQFLRKHV
jgi:c-di-GMP-binding flagellar brake protein YcgR